MFLPGESHGQRSLVGCRPWGRTESDATEATWQQQYLYMDFPGGSVVKNLPANPEDVSLIPGSERSPGEGNGNPIQ